MTFTESSHQHQLDQMLDQITESFTISDQQLTTLVSSLHSELTRSLQRNHRHTSELHMLPSFIHTQPPSGLSLGMSIDASGKRVRITSVNFSHNSPPSPPTTQVFVTPRCMLSSPPSGVFDFVAYCIQEFIQSNNLEGQEVLPLGITIGLPLSNTGGAGFSVSETAKEDSLDLTGSNVARRLYDTVLRNHLPVRITSVTNNTVSALIAARHMDKTTRVAAAFNHGVNAAYFEQLHNIEQQPQITRNHAQPAKTADSRRGTPEIVAINTEIVAINTEIGRFGSLHNSSALPLTMWDRCVDRESRTPGARTFEKLVADKYLGEITRNILLDLMDCRLLFSTTTDATRISTEYTFHTAYMAPIMEDCSTDLCSVEDIFAAEFNISGISLRDRRTIQRICCLVARRAAKLAGAVLAALVLKAGLKAEEPVSVALSGVLFDVNFEIYEMAVDTLKCILMQLQGDGVVGVLLQSRGSDLFGAAVNAASF
ncbi:hexokinase [Kickxella alabastrina]|uniref:Hexokinase n=1 Tax=Kickxella alabastrina TaxID=61397 RepID=A0ACC1IPD4_9FUNG|nr:hexokinase [Kickxella alabastrina]